METPSNYGGNTELSGGHRGATPIVSSSGSPAAVRGEIDQVGETVAWAEARLAIGSFLSDVDRLEKPSVRLGIADSRDDVRIYRVMKVRRVNG